MGKAKNNLWHRGVALGLALVLLMLPLGGLAEDSDKFAEAFKASGAEFSDTLVRVCAEWMRAPAEGPEACEAALQKYGFADTRSFDYEAEHHAAGLTLGHRLVPDGNGGETDLYAVVLRGSKTTQNWLTDMELGFVDFHVGFYEAAQNAWEHIQLYIDENNRDGDLEKSAGTDYKVILAGHSLGAAVSNVLAGVYLKELLPAGNVYAYLFATPRVAKQTHADPSIRNFIYAGDLVPAVPLEDWGFSRFGIDCYLDAGDMTVFQEKKIGDAANLALVQQWLGQVFPSQTGCAGALMIVSETISMGKKLFGSKTSGETKLDIKEIMEMIKEVTGDKEMDRFDLAASTNAHSGALYLHLVQLNYPEKP